MKRNKLSLFSLILGIIIVGIFSSTILGSSATNEAELIGEAIGKYIVLPSAVAMLTAVILNGIGYFQNSSTITLLSAILYIISLLLMPLWGFLGIPNILLQFITFSKMKKSKMKG